MWEFINQVWGYVSVAAITAFVYSWYYPQLTDDQTISRKRLRDHVSDGDQWGRAYRGGLSQFLAHIDRHVFGARPEKGQRHPWTAQSLSFCLMLAFLYPLASLLGLWFYGGVNTSGVEGLLPEDASAGIRAVLALLLVWISYFSFRGGKADGWKVWFLFGLGLGPVMLASYFGIVPKGAAAVAGAVAGAVSVAGAFAVAVAGAGAGAVAVAVAGAGAGAVAVAVTVAILFLQEKASERGLRPLFYAVYFPLMLLAVLLGAGFAPEAASVRNLFTLGAVFLILLPLVNALWDWLSLGFTRWALALVLHKGQTAGVLRLGFMVLWSLVDAAAALVFLSGLALTMTFFIELANLRAMAAGGPPLLDLAQLFARLRDTPGEISLFWVYLTLFSTFVPTFLHLLIMSTALFTIAMPKRLRNWVMAAIDKGFKKDVRNHMLVAAYFTARLLVSFAVLSGALAAVAIGLWHVLPGLGKLILYLCSELQQWLNPSAPPVFPSQPGLFRAIEV